MPRTNSQKDNVGNDYARYVGLGFTFVFIIAFFTVGGYFVDKLFGTSPLLLFLGLVIGFAGALYYLFLTLSKLGNG